LNKFVKGITITLKRSVPRVKEMRPVNMNRSNSGNGAVIHIDSPEEGY